MPRNRLNRRIPNIRRAQNAFNKHGLCELVLGYKEVLHLMSSLLQLADEMDREKDSVIVHFLSHPENMESKLVSKVYVKRITVLAAVELNESDGKDPLKKEILYKQYLDFCNDLGDY